MFDEENKDEINETLNEADFLAENEVPNEPAEIEPEIPVAEENSPIEQNVSEIEVNTSVEPQISSFEEENVQIENSQADTKDLVTVSPVEFSSFEDSENILSDNPKLNLDIVQDVQMRITVELGRAKCSVKKILDFQKGSIVELNKVAGEQVELFANGKFVAFGEVIVIEDKFGLRVTSVAHKPKSN